MIGVVQKIIRKGTLGLAALALVISAATPFVRPQHASAAGHVGSTTCPPSGAPSPFNRAICDGYFTGVDQWNAGVDVDNVLANPGGNGALMQTTNVDEFISAIENGLNGADPAENTGTAFLIESMLGKNGTDFTTISGGVIQAKADFAYWEGVVRWYDSKGYIDWNAANTTTNMSNFVNTGVSTKANNDAIFFMDAGPKARPLITFTNPDGSKYIIDKNCANPTGLQDPLSSSGLSLEPLQPKVSVGNFVWFDANNDGVVNQNDATAGFNGVNMNLYNGSADTNSDGVLSAAEVAAATPAKTTATANDNRSLPTNGRAGYYEFTDLDEGDYFVCIAAGNFGSGGKLNRYSASPVPSGVTGDSRSDNKSHGSIPTGGTAQSSGMCASRTALTVLGEPTTTTNPADDDTDPSSDTTIDFGFWHNYSLGNRVWLDKDNSGDINGADGTDPGITNVTVALYDCSNNQLATTTTDASGHFRFDNLNAGCYQTEVVKTNFTTNSTLMTCNVSSTGPKQSANPDNNIDSDDNGINPANAGDAVRSGSIHLGPFNSAPLNEADLAVSGQGNDDDFANMTLDFGFICNADSLANTGANMPALIATAATLIATPTIIYGVRRLKMNV